MQVKMNRIADFFTVLKERPSRSLVVVNGIDSHTIQAVAEAVNRKIARVILTGDETEIRKQCAVNEIDPSVFEIIHAGSVADAARIAVQCIQEKKADMIMKGLVSTDQYMRVLLNKEYGLLPQGGVLTHVMVLENPSYHKLIAASDVAVIPYPTMTQKIAQIAYLANTARALGVEKPKIAVLAPTEHLLPGIQSCVDADALSRMGAEGQLGDVLVAGPMAFDVAIDRESAEIKGVSSPVAGDADCLLFPNIDAGNVFYKVNTKWCESEQAAVVVGTSIPAVLSSRGDSIQTKLNSIALAALLCETK